MPLPNQPPDHPPEALIAEQISYYRSRAGEYDASYGERMHQGEVSTQLARLPIHGDVLELACGTGQWSRLIASRAGSMTLLDASPEMLAIAQARLAGTQAEFVEADLFEWSPTRTYDTVFFAFWLSHVPPSHFEVFWSMVRRALAPGGMLL